MTVRHTLHTCTTRDLAICMLHTDLAHLVPAGQVQVGEVSPPVVFVQFAVATGEKVESLFRLFMVRSTSGLRLCCRHRTGRVEYSLDAIQCCVFLWN